MRESNIEDKSVLFQQVDHEKFALVSQIALFESSCDQTFHSFHIKTMLRDGLLHIKVNFILEIDIFH